MLKGAEALALAVSDLGLRHVYAAPGGPLRRTQQLLERHAGDEVSRSSHGRDFRSPSSHPGGERPDFPCPTLGGHLAAGLALGGALLAGRPAAALLGPAGLLAALPGLGTWGLMNEYRSPALLLEGPSPGDAGPDLDTRPAAAAAGLPVFEPGSADELYHLLGLASATSAAGGLPVLLRAGLRALGDRAQVRPSLPALVAPPGDVAGVFSRDDAPYLCSPAAAEFHRQRRAGRLQRLTAAAAALTSRTGAGTRGVVLAGPLGPRAQLQAAARGLCTLRLGLSWPLPEAVLVEFLGGLQEALVLEEGGPFLLGQVQAMAHRAGLAVRVRGPEAPLRDDRPGQTEELLAAFAGGQPAGTPLGTLPGYDLGRARLQLALRPRPDAMGEIDEEPWPLYLARLRHRGRAAAEGEPDRLLLHRALQRLGRPALVVAASGPAFVAGAPQVLSDVQVHPGWVAPVAGALAAAAGVTSATGRPLAVAVLDGEHELAEEHLGLLDNARAGRDVIHVLIHRTPPGVLLDPRERRAVEAQLAALGLEVAAADLPDEEGIGRALLYLGGRRGARALVCYGVSPPPSSDSRS